MFYSQTKRSIHSILIQIHIYQIDLSSVHHVSVKRSYMLEGCKPSSPFPHNRTIDQQGSVENVSSLPRGQRPCRSKPQNKASVKVSTEKFTYTEYIALTFIQQRSLCSGTFPCWLHQIRQPAQNSSRHEANTILSKSTGEATMNLHPDVCQTPVWLEACWRAEKGFVIWSLVQLCLCALCMITHV